MKTLLSTLSVLAWFMLTAHLVSAQMYPEPHDLEPLDNIEIIVDTKIPVFDMGRVLRSVERTRAPLYGIVEDELHLFGSNGRLDFDTAKLVQSVGGAKVVAFRLTDEGQHDWTRFLVKYEGRLAVVLVGESVVDMQLIADDMLQNDTLSFRVTDDMKMHYSFSGETCNTIDCQGFPGEPIRILVLADHLRIDRDAVNRAIFTKTPDGLFFVEYTLSPAARQRIYQMNTAHRGKSHINIFGRRATLHKNAFDAFVIPETTYHEGDISDRFNESDLKWLSKEFAARPPGPKGLYTDSVVAPPTLNSRGRWFGALYMFDVNHTISTTDISAVTQNTTGKYGASIGLTLTVGKADAWAAFAKAQRGRAVVVTRGANVYFQGRIDYDPTLGPVLNFAGDADTKNAALATTASLLSAATLEPGPHFEIGVGARATLFDASTIKSARLEEQTKQAFTLSLNLYRTTAFNIKLANKALSFVFRTGSLEPTLTWPNDNQLVLSGEFNETFGPDDLDRFLETLPLAEPGQRK